jgi:hypothetical protein
MIPDPIAIRVARRHQAAALPGDAPTTEMHIRVGTIFAIEPKLLVEALTGYLRRFRFLPTKGGPAMTVAWEGVAEGGEVVSGMLVLHMEVGEVAVRAEVVVDHQP